MIYLDNAATGGFKPNSVIETATSVIKYLNANPGRSGHRLSKTGASFVYSARKKLSEFFNNGEIERVIFTKNCSEGLNTAIHGVLKNGDHVITTCFEHNSVLRPLFTLEKAGVITLSIVYPENNEFITKSDIEKAYTKNTKLVAVNHISNVNGSINDIKSIGKFLSDKNSYFLVDGAQSAGHVKIDMQKNFIDILSVAGHKGLYAVQGSGALILGSKVEISPTFQGGTGTESFNALQPDCYPEKLEVGTLNLPAICSLEEGVRYIESSIDYLEIRLTEMTFYLINRLSQIDKVQIYSKPNPAGIVAFSIDNCPSVEASERLSDEFDIAVRGGFHCAPLMHKFLKTDTDGLIRVSICPHNTKRDLYLLLNAVKTICLGKSIQSES
ncbi:MAG: aminotransferase class V-fold PLP-dependent enzyme [Clostridia bacterium]|nr:aminotransferase class V-fold PLP-dependent enzyme [Clostridia bacterium]